MTYRHTAQSIDRTLRGRLRRRGKDGQRGIVGVEFALLLPIFMMILFGIVEFGTAFYKQQIITSAVREAARYGITATEPRPSTSQIITRANNYLDEVGLDSAQSTVSITSAGGTVGQFLTVQISYPTGLDVLNKFIPGVAGGATGDGTAGSSLSLSATAVMEHQ